MIICIFVYNDRINILLLMIKNNFHSYTQIEIWKFDVHHTWSKSLYIPIYLLTIHVYFQNVLYSNQIIFLGQFSKTKCSCSRVQLIWLLACSQQSQSALSLIERNLQHPSFFREKKTVKFFFREKVQIYVYIVPISYFYYKRSIVSRTFRQAKNL